MTGRGTRSFRYGARLTLTAPLALVFVASAAEMVLLAVAAGSYMRVVFATIASLASLLAISMIRETVVRIRGRRRVVVAARELVVPTDRKGDDLKIRYRDIRAVELTGTPGFNRVLTIRHAGGELAISGVMLGSVGELDEIHGLVKAARKTRS
jgi:hypothetical protein